MITTEHVIAELKEQLWRTWIAEKQVQLLTEENATLKAQNAELEARRAVEEATDPTPVQM